MEIDDVYLTNNSKVESISIISSPLCNHTQFKEIKNINNDTLNYIFCSTDDISKIIYDENTFNTVIITLNSLEKYQEKYLILRKYLK